MHNGPDGFIFTVFNKAVPPAAATPYDFTGLTDLFLKIYAPRKVQKRTELLVTIDQGDPGVEVSGNVITWNSDYDTDIGLFEEDTYYYELSWVNAAGKLITIAFDGLTII
jgi:hypothetical protein